MLGPSNNIMKNDIISITMMNNKQTLIMNKMIAIVIIIMVMQIMILMMMMMQMTKLLMSHVEYK